MPPSAAASTAPSPAPAPEASGRQPGLDALRLGAAFAVVTLHVSTYDPLPDPAGAAIRLAGRWAVPFFFLVSGYFLARRDGQRDRTLAPLARLVVIFVVASAVLAPVGLAAAGPRGFLEYVFLADVFVRGTYYHLWFLTSLILGLLVVLVGDHYGLRRLLPVLGVASLVAYLALGAYNPVSQRALEQARQVSAVGFLWLGMVLARRGVPGPGLSAALAVGGLLLQYAEAAFLAATLGRDPESHQFFLGTTPLAVGLFGLALRLPASPPVVLLADAGRRHALGVYLLHPAALFAFDTATAGSGIAGNAFHALLRAPAAFALTLGLLVFLERAAPGVSALLAGDAAVLRRLDRAGGGRRAGAAPPDSPAGSR